MSEFPYMGVLEELKQWATVTAETIAPEMQRSGWAEINFRLDICHATNEEHVADSLTDAFRFNLYFSVLFLF
jgi:hypothetical protein